MSQQYFDAHGRLLGVNVKTPSGTIAFSPDGKQLGNFVQSENLTFDAHGRLVGFGNQTPILFNEDQQRNNK